ncbi:ABC transporter ATP-binding protein [Pantoea sp. DY-5]|uniref:ABC transporter ATP-binding protein n=1 Tax=Pantoea sp. DY-5 TaxID=2871488 RepID=UPI001C9447D3|nr:ABC transporter ATP-binding protein [Pantoea sp. DY-5]MBY4840317.1 ABC transporter ATP-binding protein [Pantoea sp. DY-5]
MSAILEFRHFSAHFGDRHAVQDLDLSLQPGEMLALVGESGSGKSITALAALRLTPSAATLAGEIRYQGLDLLAQPEATLRRLRGKSIAMIFQDPMTSLNPVLTVGQQLAETVQLHLGLPAREARQRAIALLEQVNIPHALQRIDDYPHHFSGGQRQRIMIAMAIACEPQLLIADEPTTALDATVQKQILELLDRLRHQLGMSVLFITHDLGLVEQYADRVAVLYRGIKVEESSKAALFAQPQHPYTRGLLAASLHAGETPHYRQRRLTEIVHHPDGPPRLMTPEALALPEIDAQSAPLLSLDQLHFRYPAMPPGSASVRGVSLHIRQGETLGLVGESGCGKSTLSRLILGLLKPDGGEIQFAGQRIDHLRNGQRALLRPRIQMIFQDPFSSLNPRHSVEEILRTPLRVHGRGSRAEQQRAVRDILDQVGLPEHALQRYPHEFSGGQRQRIGIARALILDPDLLICDEPVSALDVSVQAQILNLLVSLKQQRNLSLLFISHDLAVVRYIADRVMVMYQGEMVEQGDHQQIWQRPVHAYTQQLLASVRKPAVQSLMTGTG